MIANYKDTRLIDKTQSLSYTSNEQVGLEMKNTIPFTLAPERMKYLGMNLTKICRSMRKMTNFVGRNQRTK